MSGDKAAPTYIRRRAYNKVHVRSWLIYLEKDGFVRCSFKNCDFMAFDVEEMCSHYGFCKGESSFAKYVCPICEGRTNKETKLKLHMAKAHNYAMPESIDESPEPAVVGESNSKPSRVLVASWGCFFEANNYIKCTTCSYLANTLQDMQRHYSNCKKEMDQLLYVCPECKGRSATVNPLLWHMERSHKIFKSPNQFNHIAPSMMRFWQRELEQHGQACCLHIRGGERDCFFFDVDILGIIEHAQTCKGPQYLTVKVQCPDCKKWTNTVQKLSHHTKVEHSATGIAAVPTKDALSVRLGEDQPINKHEHGLSSKDTTQIRKCLLPYTESFENVVISEMSEFSMPSIAIKKDTKEEDSWLIAMDNENDTSSGNTPMENVNVNREIRTSTISNDNFEYEIRLEKSHKIEESIQKQCDNSVAAAIQLEFSQEEEEDQVMVIDLGSDSNGSREVQEVINSGVEGVENSNEYLRTQQTEVLKKEDIAPVGYEVSFVPNCSDDVVVEVHSEGDPQESHITCGEEEIIISLEENRNENQEEEILVVPQDIEDEVLKSNVEEVCSVSKSSTEELKVNTQKEITDAVHFNLFKDSESSDEDDVDVVQKKLKRNICEDEDTEPPSSSCEQTEDNCKRTSLKHYSKRQKHNLDSSSLSPVKCPSTSPVQDVYLESKYFLEVPVVDLDLVPSAVEAFESLNTALKWLKWQPECNSAQMSVVKQLRDLAVQKTSVVRSGAGVQTDPDPTTTINFSISEDGKILRDDQNKNKLLNGSLKLIHPVYSKPVPKISTMKRNENSEEISKSSEKNDKLMHLVVTEDSSGGQSLSTYCGKGLRKKTKFENGSIEVVDVQYNLVKTKDGSAVVENNCNMILHIDENSLSGDNSEETCFVVAVEGNVTPNLKDEKRQSEECSKKCNTSIVMLDDIAPNQTQKSDIQDCNSVNCLNVMNLKDSTPKELVVNDNNHELNTSKKHEHTSGVQGLFEEVECLKPGVNKDMKSDILCDVKGTSIEETIMKVETPSKIDNSSMIKIDKPKDCSNNNNSNASNKVENVIVPDSPNHSKTFSKLVSFPDSKSVDSQKNSKTTVSIHNKNGRITEVCRPDQNEASSLVKELAKVSFLYQGKLVRRSSESSTSVIDESTDDVKEYDVDMEMKTESNSNSTQSLKQSEPKEANNSNLSNISSKMNTGHDHLVVSNKVVMSKTNNNSVSDEESGKGTSDISRRSSSDFLNDSSEDGEDFLGTDEELDMKDQLFIGFNEMTEKLQSRRRSFHQFLNRLSESESEEWYISAGNLSMNFQKVEHVSSDELLLKHHVHHNGETGTIETTKKSADNFFSKKSEREFNCELNYCILDQDNATCTHKNNNSSLSESHNSSNKNDSPNVASEIILYNKEKSLTGMKVNKQSNNIECIKTELNNEGNNHRSLLNDKHQLGSETKEQTERKSKSGSKYEIINSQLKERKSPQKQNCVRLRNNCDNTDQSKKHTATICLPLSGSIINNTIERSNLDHSELSTSLLFNDTNSSEPCHVITEIPKNGDKSVWKCQSDGSDNKPKIKDQFDATLDQSSNQSSDQNINHNLNHSLKNNTNGSIGSNIVTNVQKESNTQTIEPPNASDEKLQDKIQYTPFPSAQEIELNNSEIKLSQEILVNEDKSIQKTGQDSQLFLVENCVRSKKETTVTAVNASEGDKINNIISSTPKKRGRKPKLQDFYEECSVLESSKSVSENPSFEENQSPYLEKSKTKISIENNNGGSVIGEKKENSVQTNVISEEWISIYPDNRRRTKDKSTIIKKRGRKPTPDKEASPVNRANHSLLCLSSLLHKEEPSEFLEKTGVIEPKQNEEKSSALETVKLLNEDQGSEENKPLSFNKRKVEANIKSSHEENLINENCMGKNAINKENVSVFPKKRGRPPKQKNYIVENLFAGANDNSIHENIMVGEEPLCPLPKKRGRKPKIKCEDGSFHETELNPIYKNVMNEEENLVLPKRRGRKPKIKHFVEDILVAGNCESSGENSIHEEIQKEVTCSDLEYSINMKRDCNSLNDTSEVSELNLLPSRKKRGRPPKNKFHNNINISTQEENFTAEGSNNGISTLTECNEEELLLSIYSEEIDMLLRNGSLQRINMNEEATLNSNIHTFNINISANASSNSLLLPNTVKRKRGRPPKSQTNKSITVSPSSDIENHKSGSSNTIGVLKSDLILPNKRRKTAGQNSSTTCVTLEHNDLNESLNSTISNSFGGGSDVLLPKKRGRPPKKKLISHESVISDLDQVESVPLSDRFSVSEKSDLKKRKRMPEGNLSDPGTELLDTDVIFINREKLTDSLHSKFEKRRGKPKRKSQKVTDKAFTINDFEDIDSDSEPSEEVWNDSEDTDFDDIPKKKKKKKAFLKNIKQEDDEDNSDKEQTKEKGNKKQTGNRKPSEDQIFFAQHKNNDMVVCGVCKKEMNYKTYKTHHSVFTHYALCWLEGEEKPVDMTDDKEVVNRLWYSKKKLGKTPFRCFNCNLPKLSAVGFQSHIRFCGKEHEMESLMATCQECGATMKPSSLRPHMYIKHSSKSKAGSVDTSSIIPKVKRAAASKADEVMQSNKDDQDIEGQLEDHSEGQSQWRPNSPQLRQMQHFYIKPNKIIPKEEAERWKTSLKETNIVTCRHPDCKFSAITTIAFRKHYFSCPFFPPKLVYKCRQCPFVSEEEIAVQEHLMQEHRELLQPSPSSSIESGSETDEGSDEERSKLQKYRYNLSLPFKFLQNGYIKYKCRSHPKRFFFSDALLWTHKMRSENLTTEILFPEAVGTAKALAVDQVSQYLPTTASSIKFRGSDGAWRSLHCFQATLVDGVPVMFTGGPVWACAWAAVPDTEDNQYLAVASHPDMNMTHEMAAVYSYPSIIQVWAVGRLVNCLPKPEPENEPHFLMGIAHNRGAVWGLQWCPSGCQQDARLGLLAAACSDGSVVIYSIPRHQPSSQHKIYEMEPVMELKLGCEMMSQCKCIEWHTVAPHSIIVGGFANGMVALWDLHTTSPLLRDGKVIYPFKVFEAHLSAVTAVSLSPTAETTRAHLMTSSLDRATKFWRLDDTTAPVNTLRKASVTDAVMPSTWMTSINAFDDVYSTNSTHIMGYSYRETFTSNNTNFYPQLGTVWGVSFNEWINAIACGSEMGKLTVLFRRQLLVTEDSKKVKSNSMRDDLILCSVQSLNDVKGNVEIGERYQDCVDKVGLDISFKGNAGQTKKQTEASVDTMENYPILSINKVMWNTNYNSFTWLAAGLQCGLVMAPHVTCLQANDLSELYQQHDAR